MSEQLLRAIGLVDQLNGWVRSPSFREGFVGSSLRRHIYEVKGRALVEAMKRLECKHRLIVVLATCRDCRGSGRYEDSWGKGWPHCRACGSSGTVRLRFVESRIAEAFVWHTPSLKFPASTQALEPESDEIEWAVNQPGRDMTVEEAAGALIACDQYWPHSLWQMDCRCGHHEDHCYRHYGLYLGRATQRCAHCGGEPRENLGCHVGQAEFTVAICTACRARLTTEQQFAVPIPAELLTPNVAEWVRIMDRIPRRKRGA